MGDLNGNFGCRSSLASVDTDSGVVKLVLVVLLDLAFDYLLTAYLCSLSQILERPFRCEYSSQLLDRDSSLLAYRPLEDPKEPI